MELALLSIVFVGLITLALHVYEVGYLSLKVQESATQTMWDATGRSLRDQSGYVPRVSGSQNVGPAREMAQLAATRSQGRYDDFDGRARSDGHREQLYTRARDLAVAADAKVDSFKPPIACLNDWVDAPGVTDRGTRITVSGAARIELAGVSSLYVGTDKGLTEEQDDFQAPSYSMCGVGRKVDGECKGSLFVVADDWSVYDNDDCAVTEGESCRNREYYRATKEFYDQLSLFRTSASDFARAAVGRSPIDENQFFVSFRDGRTGFRETAPPPGEGQLIWKTGRGPQERARCFLGGLCQR